ncbi:MAG: RNase adapter RapZ [Gammaproteobacteria bacterium]
MRLVIVSGLSGSGKSVALHMLEDLGYYCIDNLPAGLLDTLAEQTVATGDSVYERLAVGIDARNRPRDLRKVPEVVEKLRRGGTACEILFLHANHQTLVKRYSETRRKHPLSTDEMPLDEAIEEERRLLNPIAAAADLTLDSTRTSVHELRELVRDRVHGSGAETSLLFRSFGFKSGIPGDADFVFDVRCLPNPYWEKGLKRKTGLDAEVVEWLETHPVVADMLRDITAFLDRWLPECERSSRSYITVAVGCTGGCHRSVYLVEKLAAHFGTRMKHVQVRHDEITAPG